MNAWSLLRLLSWRQVTAAPGRSFLTFSAIALGVAMIVGIVAANRAVLAAFHEVSERTGGKADLEVSGDEAGVEFALVESLYEKRELVAHAAARIEQHTYVAGGAAPAERVLLVGLDFLGDTAFFPFEASEGLDAVRDPLAFMNDPHAVLITEEVARRRQLSVGSRIGIRTAHDLEQFRVAGLLRETSSTRMFGGQVAVLSLDAAQIAFGRGSLVDRIDLQLVRGQTAESATRKLQAMVGERGQVAPPSKRFGQLARISGSFQAAMEVQALLALLVGMFLVYNAAGVAVSQRKREIGVLRSLGAQRTTIAGVFLVETALLGLLGSLTGLALGKLLASSTLNVLTPTLSRLYQNIRPGAPEVDWRLGLIGCAAGVLATLVASWFPSRSAATTEPVEAMRTNIHSQNRAALSPRMLGLCGLAAMPLALLLTRSSLPHIAFLGVILLPLGAALCTPVFIDVATRALRRISSGLTPGALGIENARRDLGRSGLTAGALVLSAATSLTLLGYVHSFERSARAWIEHLIPADIIISAGSPLADQDVVPIAPAWVSRFAALPGVDAAMGIHSLSTSFRGLRVEMMSLDSELYLSRIHDGDYKRVLEGPTPIPTNALVHEPSVLVSENLAARTNLHYGDQIELQSPTGPHLFRVAAVVVDYQSDQGTITIDRRFVVEFWQDDRVDSVDLFLQAGRSIDEVIARARQEAGGDEGFYVLKSTDVKAEILHMLRQTLSVARASEAIAIIIALLGAVGTTLAAVIDRRREYAVLRALGASGLQIMWTITSEAAWLALCAVIVASVVSAPLVLIFLDVVGPRATGWSIPLSFPLADGCRFVALLVGAGMIAGAIPGLRATRTTSTEALSRE